MREKVIIICLCLVGLSSLSLSPVYADDTQTPPDNSSINYDLTYPGLLPDNPLYFLKMARDNLLTFFMGKPVEKASFLLLQSDKQLAAAKLLLQKNKDVSLVHETVINSQKYFDDAIETTVDAKKEGFDIHELVTNLQSASKKHHDTIDEIYSNLSSEDKKQFADVTMKADELKKTTASLRP